MTNFILFIVNHWILVSLFLLILIVLMWVETQGKVAGMARVDTQQAIDLINRKSAVVLDIRERSIFDKGHIAHAISVDQSSLETSHLDKHKGKPIIVVCTSGMTASKLGPRLKKLGLNPLYVLQGGMNAWQSANLPLVKK